MVEQIPKSESLKDTLKRSKVYWDEVVVPSLLAGRTVLIVGHENNLRSLVMNLEGISEKDIINLNLPRAVPLAYKIGHDLRPAGREDGKFDEATGMLRGTWLGGSKAVSEILDRDHKQVYDTTIEKNLELGTMQDQWRLWMDFALGKPEPDVAAKSTDSHHSHVKKGRGHTI
jgi:2,3-bisphosphoglycerate-dependent phosphoglycerate mutase